MIALQQWAIKHGVSSAALADLANVFGLNGGHDASPETIKGARESAVQNAVRLEAARKGIHLWRNNVGSLLDARGIPVRYGLANDSKALNERLKSADLIGWRPLTVQQHMIGWTVAQFVSRECKAPGWRYSGNEREAAQLAWAQLVLRAGGDAGFAAGVGTL